MDFTCKQCYKLQYGALKDKRKHKLRDYFKSIKQIK